MKFKLNMVTMICLILLFWSISLLCLCLFGIVTNYITPLFVVIYLLISLIIITILIIIWILKEGI